MKRFSFLLSLIPAFLSLQAEVPGWIHDASISPDGKNIAFSYKGEIFIVPTAGGIAFPITSGNGFNGNPVWSPDNKNIVFLSDREGSDDLYITSAKGGTPRRLTTHSGNETPLAFLNDSIVLFNAAGLPGKNTSRAPFLTQVYSLNVIRPSSRPTLFLSIPVASASVNSNGEILFQDRKGYEDVLRKHEHSSGTSDIVMYADGVIQTLTDFKGQDQSPTWGEGNTYFYLSEADGTLNVYEATVGSSSQKQLTSFEKNPVRSLSASSFGLLAFCQDGVLYTLKPGQQPSKVNIEIEADLYDSDAVKRYVTEGADNFAVSPDGSEIALVIRGEIYVTDAKYKTTKRITDTPWQERTVSFSPDGRSLVFDSDVDGIWTLYLAKIKNQDEKSFAYSTDIEIEPLYSCSTSAMQPAFSPDGKKVAFLENRDALRVIDVESKETVTALDGQFNYSYSDGDIPFEWSPDSHWLVTTYLGGLGWNNLDIAVAKADGSEVINLSESGYTNENPKWVLDGKGITYTTAQYGMKSHGSWGNQSDVILMVLDPTAWEEFNYTEEEAALAQKAKEEKESSDDNKDKKKTKEKSQDNKSILSPDFKNRRYRKKRLTQNSSILLDYYLNPDGSKLYYVAQSGEDGFNIYEVDLREKETSVFAKNTLGGFIPSADGEKVFLAGPEGISLIDFESGDMKPVEYEAFYDRKPSQEREYIYGHVVKQVEDKFYDPNLHGVDWKYYSDHYREFLPYISNNRDFATLLSELLGELNASHTGARYRKKANMLETAFLGAYFDDNQENDGLTILEIFPEGPLAAASAALMEGDVITSIDGVQIKAGSDYFPLLEGKGGKKIRLGIRKTDGTEKFVTIKPLSPSWQSELAYRRWIENNEKYVDSISGGKIGYVHVRGMDTESFQSVYDRLLGKYRTCDAVVVDTRWNGGGWLHNDLAVLLSGHKYVTFAPRGKEIGIEPFSQWTKPSVMLVNESNYSDAHGSPFTYKALEIGDIVGAPIPGTMTAVWWENQIDPTIVFGIPQVTNIANDGTILENTQLNPDILIYNDNGDIELGIDAQLEGAVKHLMK